MTIPPTPPRQANDGPPAGTGEALRPGGRDSAPMIRARLREDILRGRLPPGSRLSQARIAAELGVSRGPVREAFRLLESEGLLDTRVNQRARVADLNVEDLEHVYSLRVANEAIALSVSVGSFTAPELDRLDELAEELRQPATHAAGFDAWDRTHQAFHTLLLAHAGTRMLDTAADWAARTRRYRRTYLESAGGWSQGAAEHAVLAQLCRSGEADAAARLLAVHLARAALTLVAIMAPTHEPVLLRTALRQVVGTEVDTGQAQGTLGTPGGARR